jgi:predicted acylesterase/phospholipase RssA
VGSLKVLEEKGILKNIRSISGVSAGAWLAFMVSMGLSMSIIEKLIIDLDFSIIRNITADAFLGFPETYGIDDGTNLIKILESIMRVAMKLDPGTTFADLHSKKILFRCWATDLNTQSLREFSIKTSPTVKIIDALHASMSIPLYFTPVIDPVTGHYLTDGGIQGVLPIHKLTDDECEHSLAIGFSGTSSNSNPSDLIGFIYSVISSLLQSRNDDVVRKWDHKIIRIPVNDFSSLNFEISREERILLIKRGSESCRKWLESKSCGARKILRRHSFQ